MKGSKKRVLALLSVVCLLITGVCATLPVSAESYMNSGTPMESATITFVKTDDKGEAAETDFTQTLNNYNEHDGKSNGKGTLKGGYWILMDRYVGMTTFGARKELIFTPTTSNYALVVEWNRDTCRFEVTKKYMTGFRQLLTIPRYGFILYQYNTLGGGTKDPTFFTNLAIGTEVKIDMDEMMTVIMDRQTEKTFSYETYEQMILRSTAAQIEQLKTGTHSLTEVEEITISSLDNYTDATTGGATDLTGSPISFHPDVYNSTLNEDLIGLFDAKVADSVIFPNDTSDFYIPLAPVEGEPGVYQVQQYTMPNKDGSSAVTPLDKSGIPQDGYLLCIRNSLSECIGSYANPKADTRTAAWLMYLDLGVYFAPGKKFSIVNEAPDDEATATTSAVVGNVRYDVTSLTYSDGLKAEDVQVADTFTVIAATGANQWTPAFSADNTVEAIVVDGVITAFGDAASGTYIPAGGYVISASGDKKDKLAACNVGDAVTFKGVAKPTYNEGPVLFFGQTVDVNGTNVARPEDGCVLYNGNHTADTTGTDTTGIELVVDKNGVIVSLGGNNNTIPEDGFVLSFGSRRVAEIKDLAVAGVKVSLNATGSKAMLYRSPSTLAEAGIADADVYTQLLAEAGAQMKDLPYETIEAAIAAAKVKAQAIAALQNPGADADKKAAFADAVGKAVDELQKALDSIANQFVPIVTIEDRAAWITPAEKTEDEVRAVLQAVKAAKLNTVYVAAWQNGFTAFTSKNEELKPMAALEGFDALKAYVKIGHELGLEVRAWVDTLRVATADPALKLDDPNAYFAKLHQEWLLFSRNGNDFATENGKAVYYLDPTHADMAAMLSNLYEEIVGYGVDGIVMDTIRFPENAAPGSDGAVNDYGFNSGIMDGYAEKYGTLAFFIDDTHEEWQQWLDYKALCVNQLVYRLTTEVKSQVPALKVAAVVSPEFETMADTRAQDALDWATKQFVDELIVLGEYSDTVALQQAYESAKKDLDGMAWLTMGITVKDLSETVLANMIETLQGAGCTGVALYDFANLSSEAATKLAESVYRADTVALPENPSKVTAAVLNAMVGTLENVYAKYDAANKPAYEALSAKVKALIEAVKGNAYDAAGLTTVMEKLAALTADVDASAAADNAKAALKGEIAQLTDWLKLAQAQKKVLASTALQDLTAELELGYDPEPVADTTYPLTVTATAKRGDDTFTVRLTSSQYTVKKVAGDMTAEDGTVTVGANAGVVFEVSVGEGYALAVADSVEAVEVNYGSSEGDQGDGDQGEGDQGEGDQGEGDQGDGNHGEGDQGDGDIENPDEGYIVPIMAVVMLMALAVVFMNVTSKRSKA